MTYEPDFLKKITTLGTLGYPVEKIINILDISIENEKQFTTDFNILTSEVRRAYQKGVDKSDFAIDQKLFELAQTGDIQAIEKYEMRKAGRLSIYEETRKRLFG